MIISPNQKVLIIGAVAAVGLFFFAVYQIWYKPNSKIGIGVPPKQMQSAPLLVNPHMVLGAVEKISGQEITIRDIKIRNMTSNTSVQVGSPIVAVVGSSTVVEKLVLKNSMIADEKSSPFVLEKISLSSVKVGDMVAALVDGDVSGAAVFTALRINVQSPVAFKKR